VLDASTPAVPVASSALADALPGRGLLFESAEGKPLCFALISAGDGVPATEQATYIVAYLETASSFNLID
jgi:hypothetical protein